MRLTIACTTMLLLPAIACGPEPATSSATGSETRGSSDSSTGAATTATSTTDAPTSDAPTTDATTTDAATTDAPTTGTPTTGTPGDACGPRPPALACDGTEPPDPAVDECAARPQASCDGPIDDEGLHSCAWAEFTVFAQDDLSCAAGEPVARCIALAYQGNGCGLPGSCGIESPLTRFYRLDAACKVELMLTDAFCESQPVGWEVCYWSDIVIGDCAQPWPEYGPAACNCGC